MTPAPDALAKSRAIDPATGAISQTSESAEVRSTKPSLSLTPQAFWRLGDRWSENHQVCHKKPPTMTIWQKGRCGLAK